jgi:NAD-dependent SIR2 family protein deacetylase
MSTGSAPPPHVGSQLEELAELLSGRRVVALSGAGCSTESGIPDYRGPSSARRSRSPVRYQEFMARPEARRRYWARSFLGWPSFAGARPNAAHRALAELEAEGVVVGVITQNVDGLHQAAGTRSFVELHGSLSRVRCMGCRADLPRDEFQELLAKLNPDDRTSSAPLAPDGDADVIPEESFRVPDCALCGGILKPAVVFFGESVPAETLERSWRLYETGEVLLVLGSSLEVFSGRRFVLRATRDAKPLAVVNMGPTRADTVARLKIDGQLGEVIPRLAETLRSGSRV